MTRVLLVFLGGGLGSVLRYLLGAAIARAKGGTVFPLETTAINVTGCLVFGFLAGLSAPRGGFGDSARAFLFVGLLGGYTTFSTFGNETFVLLRTGHAGAAALSAAVQLGLGVAAVAAGDLLGRMLAAAA